MDGYSAVKCEDKATDKASCEVNHNRTTGGEDGLERPRGVSTRPIRNYTTEVIELPNDGRVEVVASRRFGKQVTSWRKKDEVRITLDHEDTIHVVVAAKDNDSDPNILQRCGARIPHGPAVLDAVVSGLVFMYAFLLTLLVAHVRENWKYLSIMMLWFFYIILRMNTYKRGTSATAFGRKLWHFTGMSFSIMFMYATLVIVFPVLIRDAFYDSTTTNSDIRLIMPSLKASAGFTLIGMAARRSFHCGKILGHMDIINSILLDNVDIFNLVETLGVVDGDSPMIPEGSVMEICILVACEVAFLIIALEALMPYSLLVLDRKNVGMLKHNVSIQESKEQAIVMMYPYSLLVLNVPFLVIRLALFAKYDTLQLGYVIKNVSSILFGTITLIRARNSLKGKQVKRYPEFSTTGFQQRRVSV